MEGGNSEYLTVSGDNSTTSVNGAALITGSKSLFAVIITHSF